LNRPVLNKLKTRNQVGHKLIWTLFIPGKPELSFSNSRPALAIPLQKNYPGPSGVMARTRTLKEKPRPHLPTGERGE
jgi:hypothetical protein